MIFNKISWIAIRASRADQAAPTAARIILLSCISIKLFFCIFMPGLLELLKTYLPVIMVYILDAELLPEAQPGFTEEDVLP